MTSLKVAAVQFPLAEAGNEAAFFAKIEAYVQEAKDGGAELVVFPELITTELVDWYGQTSDIDQLKEIARDFTPRYFKYIQELAIQSRIAILGGTTPRLEGSAVRNTAILSLADGRSFYQDKLFLTPDEKAWGWEGGDRLNVVDLPWGKTVVAICFDCEFPIISNMLVKSRPDVILVPSWTGSQSGLNRVDWTARARAVEHFAYVIKTGTVQAPGARLPHFGQAGFYSPQEQGFPTTTIEGTLNQSGLVFGDLDLATLKTKKNETGLYPGNEQILRTKPIVLGD